MSSVTESKMSDLTVVQPKVYHCVIIHFLTFYLVYRGHSWARMNAPSLTLRFCSPPPSWALGTAAPGIPDVPCVLLLSAILKGTLSAHITPRNSIQHFTVCPPTLLSQQIFSQICVCHVHNTGSRDAPWSSERKEHTKGLRASSDRVIPQAFYWHFNCFRVYLYMHTQARAHTTNSVLWLKGKRTPPLSMPELFSWCYSILLYGCYYKTLKGWLWLL